MPASNKGIVSFEDARHIVEGHAALLAPLGVEIIDLLAARGRILAEPVVADRDFPPFDRATRDGYAVRAADTSSIPARLSVAGEIRAGGETPSSFQLQARQAISIMTGAPLPAGADAVVMVEHTQAEASSVEVRRSVQQGENFVARAAEARAGQTLLAVGTRIDHAAVALASSVGAGTLRVYRKPRVAILATGDEIVPIDAVPGPAQIRNSNTYSLAAQVEQAGGEPVLLPIAPDASARLQSLLEDGLGADLLLIAGGVSMGKYDLVEQVLSSLRAEFFFTGALIQPGRPVVFGRCPLRVPSDSGRDATCFLGLPGNPVSTMVTFELFARPLIDALAGGKPQPLTFLQARLKSDVQTKTGLTRFLPARLTGEMGNSQVELVRWQGSGDIAALALANCYLVVPPDRERIAAGEPVFLLLR